MKKIKYRFSVMKQLYPFLYDVKGWFVGNVFISILLKIALLLIPVFYGVFIEKVIVKKKISYFLVVLLGYVFIQLMISILRLCKVKCKYKVNNHVFKSLRKKILHQYLNIRMDKYLSVKTGDVKMIIEDDVDKLSSFGEEQTIDYFLNNIYTITMIIILLCIDWRLALVSFLFIPITFILDHIVSKREKGVSDIINRNFGEWGTWLDESLKGWKEIRVNQLTEIKESEFDTFQNIDESNFSKWIRFWVTRVLVIPKVKDDFAVKFVLYFIGGILIYQRYLTIGILLIFVQYYEMLANSVKSVSLADANLQSQMPYYDRVLERLENNDDILVDGEEEINNYDIIFSDVSFNYNDSDKEIIKNLSFNIKEGARIGIKGASGTGKSTLLKLLLGILQPVSGRVEYGGIDLNRINKKNLYKNIAYISQESILFNDTIMANLCLGNENAELAEVKEACEKAQIYDFIESLPEGLNTVIGENGSTLSGGQRQRLILARAFLSDANILVFDEATSALDKQVEKEIQKTIECIPKEKTIIIVAHRDSLFEICDRVISL